MHDSVGGDPMWLVQEHGDSTSLDVVKMTNVLSNGAAFATTRVLVNPYFTAVSPKQPGGSVVAGNVDSRILKSAEWDGTLVAAQTISTANGDRDMVRWYSINVSGVTPSIIDQGNVTDVASGAGNAGVYDFNAAIDVNASLNFVEDLTPYPHQICGV